MMVDRILPFVFLITCLISLKAQVYQPGGIYFSENEYIEYQHGNLPIILSSPHGGEKKPTNIPDRDCNGCVYVNDTNTKELTYEISNTLHELTGCYPYVVLNRLHRSKLDANREIIQAADGNSIAEKAWTYYHEHIEMASDLVELNFGKGLFLDMHGHAHTNQRLELGYLLSKSNLQLDNNELDENNFDQNSSIRNLATTNLNGYRFSELIRGDFAFGTFIDGKGYPSVPSDFDPFPLSGESYFTGGFNTRSYGSVNSGSIDAIQIECNQDVRFVDFTRKRFADSLARSIIEFMEVHYFDFSIKDLCTISTIHTLENLEISVYPNPAYEYIHIESEITDFEIDLVDIIGRKYEIGFQLEKHNKIDVSRFDAGFYIMLIRKESNILGIIPIVIE